MIRIMAMASLALHLAFTGCGGSRSSDEHDHDHGAHGEADHAAEKGPHGGRLLGGGDELAIEVTIFEQGVPPEFRLYPFTAGRPLPPGEVQATVQLNRLGGRIDRFAFTPSGDFLLGAGEVEEPHSFDVVVEATWRGQPHRWTYAQAEGRVTLADGELAAAGIEVATAGPAALAVTTDLPGEVGLDQDRIAHIVPRLAGVASEVTAKLGDRVTAGQRLAAIDSRELAEVKSEFIDSVHELELAQTTFLREERLWKRRITPEIDYLLARHKLEEVEVRRQIAEQKLLALGVARDTLKALAVEPGGRVVNRRVRTPFGNQVLTRFPLTAPIDGTVIERHITLGEAVAADADIFVIADLSTVWVEVAVPAKDLGMVRIGQAAVVRSAALGLEANGTVSYIGAVVGEATRSAQARISLPNPDMAWRPGVFVTVALVSAETPVAVAIPEAALQTYRDWTVVFGRYGDTFEIRPLTLGRRGGGWVEVTKGLEAGERYAVKGGFLLKADVGKSGASHDH